MSNNYFEKQNVPETISFSYTNIIQINGTCSNKN